MPLGYLVPEFPSQTHAFFWREAMEIELADVPVRFLSTKRPNLQLTKHEFAKSAANRTHYVFPPRPLHVIRWLGRHATAIIPAVQYLVELRQSSFWEKIKLLAVIASAADLCSFCQDENIEHLHVHSIANSAHLAALACLLGGPTYSLSAHGDLPVYGKDHKSKFRHALFVACVTRPLQKQVLAVTDLPVNRVPWITMGVNTQAFHPLESVENRGPLFRIVTVARLSLTKGHSFALQAIKLLVVAGHSNILYQIVGEGSHRQSIEAEVEILGLTDYVVLLGTQSESQVLAILQQSDVLLLTSFGSGEAAPVAVMEAMACGVPAVCSIIGGTEDMMTDGIDGFLVEQRNVAQIAEKLSRLLLDSTLLIAMGISAREKAIKVFDAKVCAARLVTTLHKFRSKI
jgi:colanic acid/amylovoran biosynthesis glycosyltransferase